MLFKSFAVVVTAALVNASLAQPLTTAFTYQGRLKNGSQLASGLHDFEFRLFGTATGGSQIGPVVCVNNVLVTEGLFTATLDFGQQYATAAQRFLEIEVRADSGLDCSNASGFLVLAPRSPLDAAPLAAHANGAFSLDAPSGLHPGAVAVDNGGKVGVGTPTPQATLHLMTPNEGLRLQGAAAGGPNTSYMSFLDISGARMGYIGDGSSLDSHMYLVSDAGDIHLATLGGVRLTATSGGNVGIGTTTPVAKLDVRGDIRLGPFGQYRAVAAGESVRIVRGVINFDGTIISGSGFTVSHPSTGRYNVSFSPAFGGTPAITATVMESFGSNTAFAMCEPTDIFGADLEVFQRGSGDFAERVVQFIAIGPR